MTVASERPVERLELQLVLADGLEVVKGSAAQSLRLGSEDERTLKLRVRCARWGNYDVGELALRARDRLGLLVSEGWLDRKQLLRVYPLPETLHRIVPPVATQPFSGNEVARQKGEGLEFADLRLFAPGDRVRSINWRASARRNELVVSDRHPERNSRRDSLPRHVRGRTLRRALDARPGRASRPRRSRRTTWTGATGSGSSRSAEPFAG